MTFPERPRLRGTQVQAADRCSPTPAGQRETQADVTWRQLRLHVHVAESPHEQELMQRRTGTTTVQHLEHLGFFEGNRVLGAHALLLDEADLKLLSGCDFHAVICATGKMNRGQGIADLPRMLGAGINVCLGTDGSASDNLDLLMAMKVTYIAQNHLHQQVQALSPETILEMATANAADARMFVFGVVMVISGVGGQVGSLLHNPSGRSTPHAAEYSQAQSLEVRGMYPEAVAAYELLVIDDGIERAPGPPPNTPWP